MFTSARRIQAVSVADNADQRLTDKGSSDWLYWCARNSLAEEKQALQLAEQILSATPKLLKELAADLPVSRDGSPKHRPICSLWMG